MEPSHIIILVVASFIVIIVLANYLKKEAIIKRKLKKAPIKRVSSFYRGDVARVVGTIEMVDTPLLAPLSNRECALYHVVVEQQKSSGKNSYWDKLIEETQQCKYLIKDGSSFAVVNSNNIKSYIVKDKSFRSGFLNEASDVLEHYLVRHGHKSENWVGMNKTIRYNEGVLEPHETIAVYGKGEWKEAVDLGFPASYGRILELSAPDNEALYLSDDPEAVQDDRL
nr:hypothetical protein [uncultured Carboxylicivirga sp.]